MVELWNKGLIWDTMIGTALIPLDTIQQCDEVSSPAQVTTHPLCLQYGSGSVDQTENGSLHTALPEINLLEQKMQRHLLLQFLAGLCQVFCSSKL